MGGDVSHEYQDIIQASVGMKRIPRIDVEGQVMQRISQLEVNSNASRMRFGSKSAIAVSMILLLMISVTAYAASEYIQIRNREGAVKVQYEASAPPASSAYSQRSYNQYEQQVRAVTRPGELVAYYIKGWNLSQNRDSDLNFVYRERRITAYSDFKREIARTGAPVFPKSLGGYSFDYGSITPESPRAAGEGNDSFYKDTLEELTVQANKAAAGKKLFLKVLPWSKPSSINGTYTKGGAHIGISATLLYGGNVYVKQEIENAVSKIKVGDTEVVYNRVNKGTISYHFLNWYNEQQDAWYILTTYGDHELSRDELLQLVKDFL